MNPLHVFSWCAIASTAIDGLILLALLLRRRRPRNADGVDVAPPVGLGWLILALFVVGIVFVAKLVGFALMGVHAFGWMRLIYLDAVAMIPAVCLFVLLSSLRTRPRERRFSVAVLALAMLGLLGAPVGVYATYIEPYRLQLEEATVVVRDRARPTNPLRVGVLADIQTDRVTDYEWNAIDRLMSHKPGIVLLPGDLLQCTRREYAAQIDEMRDVVNRLDAPGGAFFVEGDVDELDRLRPLFWGTPVRLLVNEIAETRVGEQRVLIAGIELDYQSTAARRTIRDLIEMPREGRLKILMAHRPDAVMLLPEDADIDLVVAGHTHGGQVVIPGFGPPITLSGVPRAIGAGGLHDFHGNAIYVSRGVGMERGMSPRLRLFCPPEISLLTITAGQ